MSRRDDEIRLGPWLMHSLRLMLFGIDRLAVSGTQNPRGPGPGDKSPGYCQMSLRDAFWPVPEATILSLFSAFLRKKRFIDPAEVLKMSKLQGKPGPRDLKKCSQSLPKPERQTIGAGTELPPFVTSSATPRSDPNTPAPKNPSLQYPQYSNTPILQYPSSPVLQSPNPAVLLTPDS